LALVSRLSRRKLSHVSAAANLVAAGRATGREVRLDVYGAGPVQDEAVELIESRLPPVAWRLRGPVEDPRAAMRGADVVMGGGRAALEALALGRRVATVSDLGRAR
jgi:adenine-specific DNA methylase